MTKQPVCRFSARLTPESKSILRDLAQATGVNMSLLLRYLIESIPPSTLQSIVAARIHPDIWSNYDAILAAKEIRILKRRKVLGLDNWPKD